MRGWRVFISLAGLVLVVAGGACAPRTKPASSNPTTTLQAGGPTSTAAPPAATLRLLEASQSSLLTLADLPSGWYMEDSDPGSAIADPSTYSACGPGPVVPLDVGFAQDTPGPGPLLGETIVATSSISDAEKVASDTTDRVTSCTANDKVGSTTSITVTPQPLSTTYGDESSAYKVALASGSGPALGYVVVVRKSNLVATFFYIDISGSDGLAVLENATAVGAERLGQ